MSASEYITFNAHDLTALIAVLVGFAAYWANPDRGVNRGFFAASLFVALWLSSLNQVYQGGPHVKFWASLAGLSGAAIFVPMWFIKEAIIHDGQPALAIISRGRWWLIACAVLGAIRPINWYYHEVNVSFWVNVLGLATIYSLLCRETIVEMRGQVGLKRLELQTALLGGTATGLIMMLLLVLHTLGHWHWTWTLQSIVILLFYTGTVVAITTGRIFNARQILVVAVQKLALVLSFTAVFFYLNGLLARLMEPLLAMVVTTVFALWFAGWFGERLNRWFQFYPRATEARNAIFDAARRETRIEGLEAACLPVLRGWGQADKAVLFFSERGATQGAEMDPAVTPSLFETMRQLRWATPERLARERSSPAREEVADFLRAQGLGVLVIGDGPTATALTGIGIAVSRQPFTYPQVTQLQELVAIMENALERAHFAVKVQNAERLATIGLVGASLAHEIRNPLISIKTFVRLLPEHHQDPSFRERFFKAIAGEVERIDGLTEHLLDLAAPRTYSPAPLELHPVLCSSLDLVAAKAKDKNIKFVTDFAASPDLAYTDAAAAKQVMLNLCFNAIQAVETSTGDRWIKISTHNVPRGIEMAVADSGPGIAPEIRPRLFQPFQTTKASGFGLGLAICRDTLSNVGAAISVDPPASAPGATFRVFFPVQA